MDRKTYKITMVDGDTFEVDCSDMEQKFGFLVFSDEGDEPSYGIRAELVAEWELIPTPSTPIKVHRKRR
jgi:hypothetical protein